MLMVRRLVSLLSPDESWSVAERRWLIEIGFHASTPDEYAQAFEKALSMSAEDTVAMRLRARKSATRFSEEVFAERWVEHMERLVRLQTERMKS